METDYVTRLGLLTMEEGMNSATKDLFDTINHPLPTLLWKRFFGSLQEIARFVCAR